MMLTESLKHHADHLADIDRREGHEVRLLGALMACVKPKNS